MTTLHEPLIDRITRWVKYAPWITVLVMHPDDKKEWATLRKTAAYKEVAGKLPVKFLGEAELPA